jgi:hypothetical protein
LANFEQEKEPDVDAGGVLSRAETATAPQLGDARCNPSRLIFGHEIRRNTSTRLGLEVDIRHGEIVSGGQAMNHSRIGARRH